MTKGIYDVLIPGIQRIYLLLLTWLQYNTGN